MSATSESAEVVKAPAKNKKMLIIVLAVVLLLALVGGGAIIYISKQHAATEEGETAPKPKPAPVKQATAPKTPPVYVPMDPMVVNLADPGGERVVQIGILLEVLDAKSVDVVKPVMPAIRSGVLMLLAQRTAEELLTQAGKEKLISDILVEASIPFGGEREDEEEKASAKSKKKKQRVYVEYPVIGVLFSSFIIQ